MSIIEVKDISKHYGDHVLFDHASLSVEQGEAVGIVGANGTGKSVLFQLMTGLAYLDSGEITVRGKKVGKNHDFPENVGLFVNQPGYIEFYDGITNLKMLAEIQNKVDEEEIRSCMKKVGLDPDDRTKVKNYSSGMKQKLGIAQAIMEHQDIILLDEPFNALDFQTNAEILKLLQELKQEGNTLVLTSHQHEYLEKICDRLYLILNQKIVPFTQELKDQYFALFGM